MSKLKCTQTDTKDFVVGSLYKHTDDIDTVYDENGEAWYYEMHGADVAVLCGLDVVFEVCDD